MKNKTMDEQLISFFNDTAHSITFSWKIKRMDDGRGYRDFCGRAMWEFHDRGEKRYECVWEGFETAAECVADLLLTIKNNFAQKA